MFVNLSAIKGEPKMKKQHIRFTLATIAVTCLGLLAPKAFGVTPAPDGCYPNFTTAEGCNALQSHQRNIA
jgi:hypothetical protein